MPLVAPSSLVSDEAVASTEADTRTTDADLLRDLIGAYYAAPERDQYGPRVRSIAVSYDFVKRIRLLADALDRQEWTHPERAAHFNYPVRPEVDPDVGVRLTLQDFAPHYPLPATEQEKDAARVIYGAALRRGELTPSEVCTLCRRKPLASRHIHGHHRDYSRPLEVAWVCTKCHALIHSYAKDFPDG